MSMETVEQLTWLLEDGRSWRKKRVIGKVTLPLWPIQSDLSKVECRFGPNSASFITRRSEGVLQSDASFCLPASGGMLWPG